MSLIVFVIFWHPKVVSSKKMLVAQRTSNSWLSTSPDIVSTRLGERASGFRDPCLPNELMLVKQNPRLEDVSLTFSDGLDILRPQIR